MASITIRRLEDSLKARLRMRAASHGRSMEEEAREILRHGLGSGIIGKELDLASTIRMRIEPFGGIDLKLPKRKPVRRPPELAD